MIIADKLISKIGTDKALHFLVGALATAWTSMVNDVCMWVTAVLVVIASILRKHLIRLTIMKENNFYSDPDIRRSMIFLDNILILNYN